jgi:V/A-type H+-transporting ATPase subunit E
MGLEAVKEEVIRSAKAQEESLIAEARKETIKVMDEAEKKIAEIKEKSDAETKRVVDLVKKQELASAELENKKMLLEAKKQMIDRVFTEVQKRVDGLDSKKRQEYMEKLLEKAKNDIEVENVYCNKKDVKLLKEFNAGAMDMMGGLIAENKDGTVRVDYGFDTMLENIKENELQSINKVLFG